MVAADLRHRLLVHVEDGLATVWHSFDELQLVVGLADLFLQVPQQTGRPDLLHLISNFHWVLALACLLKTCFSRETKESILFN